MVFKINLAIINGEIHTLGNENQLIEAVGVKGDKIFALGRNEDIGQFVNGRTQIIDAKGKVVLPGFIDAHSHFAYMGVRENQLDLSTVDSKAEALAKAAEMAATKGRDEWIIGTSWDESKWKDSKEYINREELDRVAPDNPVALRRVDGHLWSVNSKALEILKLEPRIVGYEIKDGKATGILKEEAADRVGKTLEPDVDGFAEGIRIAMKRAYEFGVTSIQDALVEEKQIKAYRKLDELGQLNIRVSLMPAVEYLDEMIKLSLGPGFGDEKLRLGPIKVFSDGSIGAGTAALKEPYLDNPREQGMLIWSSEELEEIVLKAHENDIQLAIHAIGDRAIELVLDCFERANSREKKDLRHRIEHCEMLSQRQIERMKKLNIIASMQPNFVGQWGLPQGMYEHRLGKGRTAEMNPFALLKKAGVKMAFGSDCMPFGPLYGIHWAVNAPSPYQRISPEDAFKAYTIGGAYASFEEGYKGTIEEGKLADLVILDGNPFTDPSGIQDMAVQLTILDGKVVYEKSK